jgi:hypothetical protein
MITLTCGSSMSWWKAVIWFSSLFCESKNLRVMPFSIAVSLKEEVFAPRQPPSGPVWMNPTTMSA